MLNRFRIIAATAVLTVSALAVGNGMAQAQTFSDGSTSPGGLVTESGGALDSFASGGRAPAAYVNRDFGSSYAYAPISHQHRRHR